MINNTGIRVLEYNKIKEILAGYTQTILGKELALNLAPCADYRQVTHLLSQTEQAKYLLELEKDIPLGGVRNISTYIKRAQIGGTIEPRELLNIYNTINATAKVKKYLQLEPQLQIMQDFALQIVLLPKLERSIETSIAESGGIRDDATDKLAALRSKITILKGRIKDKLDSILRSTEYQKYFQEQIITIRADRYVIPIKQEYRQFFPGIIHDQSSSGATVFIEPIAIVNINNEIKKLILDEKQEVERILLQLSKEVAIAGNDLLNNIELLAQLDLIFAKARLAINTKAIRPEFRENGCVDIKKGRHPLIDVDKVVPLDIHLRDGIKTLLITGPNTGGKTVSLKLVGLFVLMAQSGMFILASANSELKLYKNVFADIGDEQSIEQSLSTFSGHMKNIINILDKVDDSSLVLLDELCAGTDPSEGAALAMAILQYLQDKQADTLLSTHYNELKTFAMENHTMQNASVEFDKASLQPTYRLIMGVAGSSNALYISRKLGLAADIVQRAESFLDSEQVKLNNIMNELENEKAHIQQMTTEINEAHSKARLLEGELKQAKAQLAKKEQDILEKAKQQADNIRRQAKQQVEEVISKLKELEKEQNQQTKHQTIKDARDSLRTEWTPTTSVTGQVLTKDNAKIGMTVFVNTIGQKARVLEIKDSEVIVQIGVLKSKVKMNKCVIISNEDTIEDKPKMRTLTNRSVAKLSGFKPEIDLRGCNVQEGISQLEKYIDDAIMVNMAQIRIIHGKGTGLLRKGIEEYLTGHPAVKSFELAPLNQGGAGATIVNL